MDRFDLFRKLNEHVDFVLENTDATESDVIREWLETFDCTMDEMKKILEGK